jgi:hypothetical protein
MQASRLPLQSSLEADRIFLQLTNADIMTSEMTCAGCSTDWTGLDWTGLDRLSVRFGMKSTRLNMRVKPAVAYIETVEWSS